MPALQTCNKVGKNVSFLSDFQFRFNMTFSQLNDPQISCLALLRQRNTTAALHNHESFLYKLLSFEFTNFRYRINNLPNKK